MPGCRTCENREHAAQPSSSTRPSLEVCLIILSFRAPVAASNAYAYTALNLLLNNITDAAETTSHPTSFTAWSPCTINPATVAILTTANETCHDGTSPVFEPVLKHLWAPPSVRHVYLNYSAVSLATSSPDEKISCDVIVVQGSNPGVAGAIGKRFGWDPARSALSSQVGISSQAAFSKPGDLINDLWAWAELHPGASTPPSSSNGSGYGSFDNGSALMSTNSDEKNMSLFYAEDGEARSMEDETLITIFHWRSRADADRFKHPLQRSYGQNGQAVSNDMWDRNVAHPIRQLQGLGAKTDTFKLELRGVEPRMQAGRAAARERSGSRKFSAMASGFGEKVSGLWGR